MDNIFTTIENWDGEQLWQYLRFCDHFMMGAGDKQHIGKSKDKIEKVKDYLNIPGHPFKDFIITLMEFEKEPEVYYSKLKQILIEVLNTLRDNPIFITPVVKSHIERNPQYNWILTGMKPLTRESPDVILAGSLVNAIDLMSDISKSIRKSDLKTLTTKEKIQSLKTLSFVYNVLHDFKPNPKIFKGFEINDANKDDAEKKLLEIADKDSYSETNRM